MFLDRLATMSSGPSSWQKGMDVLAETLNHLVGISGLLELLGPGDAEIEQRFLAAAARHNGRIGVRIDYDEALSHRLQGGGYAILIPRRLALCGLTQLNGLAYGCVPLVSRTDGPTDTVIDANPAALAATVPTGFQMNAVSQDTLAMAVSRTVARSTDVRRNGSGFKPTEWGPISLGMRAGRLMLNCATN